MALFDIDWANEIDEKWRTSLKAVSLVTEVDFTDEELTNAIRFFAQQLRRNEPRLIAHHHPALFLVAMTQLGSRNWEAKTFYQKVANAVEQVVGNVGEVKRKIEDATRCFSEILKRFNMARLESNTTNHRWVGPVLLHGAVPLDHLDELLDLIKRHIRKDPSMTGESLVEFLRSNPFHLNREPMALRLFLLHGREFTADYVSRVIDYASAEPSSLPAHITNRLDEYIADDSERSLIEFPRSERPSFALTPDGSIILRLPPAVPSAGRRTVDWSIRFGKHRGYIKSEVPFIAGATRTEESSYHLPSPGLVASVLRDEFQTEISLIDPNDPLLIFDALGSLLARTEVIPPGDVTIFWPRTSVAAPKIDGAEITGVTVQSPFGWTDWHAQQVRVEQGSSIHLDQGPPRRVQPRGSKAHLVLPEVVRDVLTSDGMLVFGSIPRVSLPENIPLKEWSVLVRDSQGTILSDLTPTSFEFEVLTGDTSIAEKLTISVRGPLGKGFTKTVPVVSGLTSIISPAHRRLEARGGIEECSVQILRDNELVTQVVLDANEFSSSFFQGMLKLKAAPSCEAFRLVEEGIDLPWTSRSEHITVKRMRTTLLQIRGLTDHTKATLVFTDNGSSPSSVQKEVRRGVVEFRLRDLADHASRHDRGILTLIVGGQGITIATVIPERLVEFGDLDGTTLEFEKYTDSPVTLTVFHILQPWIPGEVMRTGLRPDSVDLPESILGNGPIRIFAEIEDEWGAGPNTQYRKNESNSKNYYPAWDMTLVPEQDVEICALLSGQVESISAPTAQTLSRALLVIDQPDAFNELTNTVRQKLLQVVTTHGNESLKEIAFFQSTEVEKSRLLIRSGLHAVNHLVFTEDDLTRTARNSPIVAFLVCRIGSITVTHADLKHYFVDQFGQELETYWEDPTGIGADGRWDTYLRTATRDLIRNNVSWLGVVPGFPLSGDNRIIASSNVLLTGRDHDIYSKRWVRTVSKSHPVLQSSDLWKLVTAQITADDLCLPAASIALSLVARLAARGEESAVQTYATLKADHEHLALIAPDLTYIDLIRAEAAVTGVLS